jgi:hypothetical protein
MVLVAGAMAACAGHSHMVHGVLMTRNATDVEHCKPIGAVQTIAPYSLPGDDLEALRDKTLAVGADAVLLNTSRASTSGVAYRCKKAPAGAQSWSSDSLASNGGRGW